MDLDNLTKKQVQKAGKLLAKDAQGQQFVDSMAVLSAWRSLHTYPINTFGAMLRKTVKGLGLKDPIIAQRLKRTPSIIAKLQRFAMMDLSRMQDIGGLRVIVGSVDDVYKLHKSLIGGRHQHEPVLPPMDYIATPKTDGYRSLHQVFRYHSQANLRSNGLLIELQIRTKLQHSWATAVETLGIIHKSSFKTGQGSDDFKRFFKLASVLFAYDEKQPMTAEFMDIDIKSIANELQDIEQKLQVFSRLRGLIITAKHIESSNDNGEYHLMELDSDRGWVSLLAFNRSQLSLAQSVYTMREIDTKDQPNIEVVLISAGNLKQVKKPIQTIFWIPKTLSKA